VHCTALHCITAVEIECGCVLDFQASSLETKQLWVKRLRELIQDRLPFLNPTLCDPLHEVPSLKAPTHKLFQPNRHSRWVLRIPFVVYCLPVVHVTSLLGWRKGQRTGKKPAEEDPKVCFLQHHTNMEWLGEKEASWINFSSLSQSVWFFCIVIHKQQLWVWTERVSRYVFSALTLLVEYREQ